MNQVLTVNFTVCKMDGNGNCLNYHDVIDRPCVDVNLKSK